MTKKKAEELIEKGVKKGYRVVFDRYVAFNKAESDFVPAANESLLGTEEEAKELAKALAEQTKGYLVNFIIVNEAFNRVDRHFSIPNKF